MFSRLIIHEHIELLNTAQRVFISGVTMEKFMLHKAI
jgi:hypothetical protein